MTCDTTFEEIEQLHAVLQCYPARYGRRKFGERSIGCAAELRPPLLG